MRFLTECRDFIRESRQHFHTTGALLPSSRFLARALVTELHRRRGAARILEVGPGTGSVTSQILRQLLPSDHLDLVELNSHFIDVLTGRFDKEWNFWRHREQVRLIHAPLENLPVEEQYDFIISGLPLNNFAPEQVRTIYQAFGKLLKPGGTLSYFEYVFIRHLKRPFSNQRERLRLYRVGRIVGEYIRDFQIRKQHVFVNVPPAMVRHLRLNPLATPIAETKDSLKPLVVQRY
jgi:phospholipid N-methyltransferase